MSEAKIVTLVCGSCDEPAVIPVDLRRTSEPGKGIPPPPKRYPPGGCAREYDRRSGTWRYLRREGVTIRKLACMYDHVRLVAPGR